MKYIILLILSLGMILSIRAQERFTLDQAVSYALESNLKIKKAKLDIADAEGQLLEYKSTGLPKINGAMDYSYYPQTPQFLIPRQFIDPDAPEGSFALLPAGTEQSVKASVQLNALLFDASFFTGLKAQRVYRELVARQADIPKEEVKLNVTKAYLNILIAKKNKEILDKNIANLSNSLRETRAIYESGFAEKLDVDRLELSLNNLKVEADKVDRLVSVSFNLLKFHMGYPIDQKIQIEDNLETLINEFTLEAVQLDTPIDYERRPEYAVANLGIKLAQLNIKRNKMAYLPGLYAFGSHQQQLQRDDLFNDSENDWFGVTVVGLNLKVPIFDGLEKKAKIQRAQIALDKAKTNRRQFERSVSLAVKNARVKYLNARESLQNTKQSLELAQNIYDTTQIKFKEGVGSSVEVSQAERELYTAQANYTDALYNLLIAKSELDKALGP